MANGRPIAPSASSLGSDLAGEGSPSLPYVGTLQRAVSAPCVLCGQQLVSSSSTLELVAPPARGSRGATSSVVSTRQPSPFAGRLRMRLAVSGRTVCFHGPANCENGWSFPSHVFRVSDIVGSRVFLVSDDGKSLTPGSHLVSAVVAPDAPVAPRWFTLAEAADCGWVSVTLGNTILPHTEVVCEEKPREDGSDVPTPPTPEL